MIKRLVKIFEYSPVLLLIALTLFICLFGNYSKTVTEGISLWFSCVLPSLFPYLFITALLSSLPSTSKLFLRFSPVTTRLFKVGGSSGYAFFLSIISGYPVGAKTVSELKLNNLIDDNESVRSACLCSTASPTFLISSVGAITFNSKFFGILLYLSHILGAILNGILFSFYKSKGYRPKKTFIPLQENSNSLYDITFSSVISVLVVGGLITVFYLLTAVLSDLKVLSPLENLLTAVFANENLSKGIVCGLLECTGGVKKLSALPLKTALPACAFLSGFGGISIIMQSIAFLKRAKIKIAPFILSKVTSAIFCLSFGFIFSLLL